MLALRWLGFERLLRDCMRDKPKWDVRALGQVGLARAHRGNGMLIRGFWRFLMPAAQQLDR